MGLRVFAWGMEQRAKSLSKVFADVLLALSSLPFCLTCRSMRCDLFANRE